MTDAGVAHYMRASLERSLAHHIPTDVGCQVDQSRFLGRGCDEAPFSEKRGFFCEKGGGNSVNEGLGKDFYRKGNSVKRFGPFTEPPDSEN